MHILQDPDISYVGMLLEETLEYAQQHIFIAELFMKIQNQKQPKCHLSRMDKLWFGYTMEHYTAMKMNEVHLCILIQINITNISQKSTCSVVHKPN